MAVAAKNFRPYNQAREPVEEYRSHYRNRKMYTEDIMIVVRYGTSLLGDVREQIGLSLPTPGIQIQTPLWVQRNLLNQPSLL